MMLTTAALPSFSQSDIRDIIENIAKAAVSNIKTKYAESSQIQRIGVFNLDRQVLNEANLSYSAFENYLTDQIIISLMNNKERLDFDVVERGSLEKVMVEQQFSMTDLVDQSKSIEAGKLLNASIILTGTYQVLPDNVSLTVKLTDVQSGCIITVMSYEMEIDKRVDHLLGIKSDMAYRQKREQRQKELYRPQKNRSQNFFGGGVSMFYLNCKGETPINQYAGTLDVSFGYRRLVTSIGYGYFSYKYDLANNHFLLAGLSLKIIPFIKLGYMLGFPLDKDNSLGQTVSSRGQMAHYLKWTFLETNSVDLSFHYTILNNDAFAENVTKKNLELYGFGIGFH
jgi:TolB-like protein